MAKKLDKRFVFSDSSVNREGFRILTEGIALENFEANPLMLWIHARDTAMPLYGTNKPIGHWEDIEVAGDVLSGVPVFDCCDELSQLICDKVEQGTINAVSIGARILEMSEEPEYLLPGQTRATVTRCDLMEVSFVDIPCNQNAVRLSLEQSNAEVPLLTHNTNNSLMKIKETMTALLSFFGFTKEKANECEMTEERLAALDVEMARLRAVETDKEAELATLRSDHEAALSAKDAEIATLKSTIDTLSEQVENLKHAPAQTEEPAPAKDPVAKTPTEEEAFLKFCDEHDGDFAAIMAEGQRLGYM